MTSFEIAGRQIGEGHPCYVIAEACVNHNGEFETALRLVEAARAAGADAVKFQLHYAEHEMLPDVPPSGNFDKPLREIVAETHLTESEHSALMAHCERLGIQYLCTAYCREAADTLHQLGVPAFKTGSGEFLNHPLLRWIGGHGKPLLVATGMSELDEVDATVGVLRECGVPFGLMHCTSEYPPVYEDLNLDLIAFYKERYGVAVGHSDHTPNIYSALAAVALGADAIEKHFTLDKTQPGPDHKVSIEPHELYELVRGIRIIEASRGTEKVVFEREREIRAWAHHSVVTLRPIRTGEVFDEGNVWVKRPGTGIPASRLHEVLGRSAARDVPANALVSAADLA